MTNHARHVGRLIRRAWLERAVAALFVAGAFAAASTPILADDVPQTDEALIGGAGFGAGDVGYLVIDLSNKQVLAERNPDQPFMPASVAKIATFVPALEILGGAHRFVTTVSAIGDLSDGVLTGSLILRGGGDPSLTGDDLRVLAQQIATAGIKRVNGEFVYDASALTGAPEIDAMQPEAAGYNSGVSALSANFNRVRLEWRTDTAGRSATVAAVSDGLTVRLNGIVAAFAGKELAGPFVRAGSSPDERWLLSPSLPAQGETWLPVGNPARMTAEVFRAVAANAGIALPEPSPGGTPAGARELARHESRPLIDISRAVLRSSNNLSAELIGLATSRALSGRAPTLGDSASAVAAWWRSHLPTANWTGFILGNHSGLSSMSRATPRQIVFMLEEAARPTDSTQFEDLLTPLGWKGVEGLARVKSGTMSYARGLAGYIDTAAGRRLAFAIFFNDAAARAALDAKFDPRVLEIDARSRSWRDRALKLEDNLVRGWVKRF